MLSVALGPEVDAVSNRNEYQEYILRVKAADSYVWQPYNHHVPIVLKIWEPQTLRASPGLYRSCFTFTFIRSARYVFIKLYEQYSWQILKNSSNIKFN
jgi:hypothetical protein